MPHWLSILLAIACWLFAMLQVRMSLIYRGRIHSPAIRPIEPSPTLAAIAIRSAATFVIYGFLILFTRWPQLLTYIGLIWTCRAIIDIFLGWFGRGIHASTIATLTEKGLRYYFTRNAVGVTNSAIFFGACLYFFGF